MQMFVERPCIDLYPGVRVTKDTVLEYKRDNLEQRVEGLVLHSVLKIKGEGYESVQDTRVFLNEGDILIYEENGRGYIKPVQGIVTVGEAIADLEAIRELGGE